MYVVVAYDGGKLNAPQYIVGAYVNQEEAETIAADEFRERGARFGVAIYQPRQQKGLTLVRYLPSRNREPYPYICHECAAALNLGKAVLDEARRTIVRDDYEDWPAWLREEIDLAMGVVNAATGGDAATKSHGQRHNTVAA